jgi:anaerobic magnesium-protoporphyrin IX monomethyl ester cyclase
MSAHPAAVFVGPELEDNLSIRTLAAGVRAAGLPAGFLRFNAREEIPAVVERLLAASPDLVGLSMAFQHRADEFLALAAALRARGYRGHICAGGHVATTMPAEVLAPGSPVDTALGHEGEDAVVRLLRVRPERRAWPDVPGLAWRDETGRLRQNPPAPARRDLDALPLPARDTPLRRHLGLPFATVAGSRGCYGSCRFCAISTFHRLRPGPRMRFRTPEHVAAELAALYHDQAARIFCFHDETLFLPRPAQTRERLDALAAGLRRRGVGRIAVIGKARPDALDSALLAHLRESLGLMRLYVGIENWSAPGLEHLGRGVEPRVAADALEACRAAGVYGCYNLLLFEPDATLEDVERNLEGMERFADVPVNFCRAEAYAGTPLWTDLRRAGRLRTDGFATDYTIADPRTQRLFKIVRQAFRDRNFAADGLANVTMSLGYERQLLVFFSPAGEPRVEALRREADALIGEIGADTRRRLGDALRFVRAHDRPAARAVADFTFELASAVNLAGAPLQERLLDLRGAMTRYAETSSAFVETAGLARRSAAAQGGAA